MSSHITKVYFINELLLKIKHDLKINFDQKPVGMWKIFLQKTDKWIFYQELEKTNTGRLSAEVANNLFDQMHCED